MRLAALLAAALFSGPTLAQSGDDNLTSWQKEVLGLVRAEPKVVESIFPRGSTASLWVSMLDDGTRRDGFAEYLCLTIADRIDAPVVISIFDAAAMARGDMVELGQTECAL